ncbi:TlpA family protein disulfide reductase [Aeromicrobium fastidiosum]|uniref:TlpA family protein disulfide reductase n=1 Tax=Aeromicrobium TaxID=2040 RepID=UPI0018D750C8|nr:TlpA disulfide reductase family protein [Aeromicrobium fastidiosum]MCL8252275.1 TlpA family protein disulfide reductase [Aeromicrobium fastidiosum]
MRRRLAATALASLLVVAGCSSSGTGDGDDGTKPTFGGGGADSSGSTVAPAELAAAKAAAGIADCPPAGAPATGDATLPATTLSCLGGGTPVDLSTLTGTPTVINLWASWCGPCRTELPVLARAADAYGDDVRFIGIDYKDGDPDAAIELARSAGVTYPLLADPDEATKADLKVVGLPQTIFVDAQGRMVATERTAYDSYDDLTSAIRRHLGVTP